MVNKYLNTNNLDCPLPLLKTKLTLADLKSGQILEVTATDPTSWADFASYAKKYSERRILAITPHAEKSYASATFDELDSFLFGSEDTGLPQSIVDQVPSEHCLRIPMMPDNRSLNLSNAASIVTYEAWRQLLFIGDISCQ